MKISNDLIKGVIKKLVFTYQEFEVDYESGSMIVYFKNNFKKIHKVKKRLTAILSPDIEITVYGGEHAI